MAPSYRCGVLEHLYQELGVYNTECRVGDSRDNYIENSFTARYSEVVETEKGFSESVESYSVKTTSLPEDVVRAADFSKRYLEDTISPGEVCFNLSDLDVILNGEDVVFVYSDTRFSTVGGAMESISGAVRGICESRGRRFDSGSVVYTGYPGRWYGRVRVLLADVESAKVFLDDWDSLVSGTVLEWLLSGFIYTDSEGGLCRGIF